MFLSGGARGHCAGSLVSNQCSKLQSQRIMVEPFQHGRKTAGTSYHSLPRSRATFRYTVPFLLMQLRKDEGVLQKKKKRTAATEEH